MLKKRIAMSTMLVAVTAAAAIGVSACGGGTGEGTESASNSEPLSEAVSETLEDADYTVDLTGIATAKISANVSVHDPSIVAYDGKYYIFGSHMAAASSANLRGWSYLEGETDGTTFYANNYSAYNPIYTDIGNEESGAFDFTGSSGSVIQNEDSGYAVWAPDVIYNESLGKWVMYYCTNSNFYSATICMAVSDTIDGEYTWVKNLIYSGETEDILEYTDILDYVSLDHVTDNYITLAGSFNYSDWPHAIDPTVFEDEDGQMWMVYGSWSGGIYLLQIDNETGDVIHPEADEENGVDAYYGKYLLGGGHTSIEAPYIIYDADAGYYYLYVSYGELTQQGGYQIRVYRSETVDGEYVDMSGLYPTNGVGNTYMGLKLSGNYTLPSLSTAYMATGHNSAFIDEDGKRYIVYHSRFEDSGEYHEPRVKQYLINEEGWPCVLPYVTNGETVSETGYSEDEVVGRYYVINQGMTINADIAEPFILYLTEKGNIFGDGITGTWEMGEDNYYLHIVWTQGGRDYEYSGVFCRMDDEAGTEVMTFSVVGSNESIWGVKYDE
ncbi:MAG: glycoside hydrolase family 43 protein [Clostridiales bacterium]|nr:glycoside hydrolase family 43 protein [Clostridiales bacterium]